MVRTFYIIPLLLLASPAMAFDLDDTTYNDQKLGLTLHAPHGWKIHRQSGYPSMLVVLVSPDGRGTISLAHGHLLPGKGIDAFLKSNCSAMRRVGLRVEECGPAVVAGHEVMRSRARSWNNATEIKQLYIKSQGLVFILTLGSPSTRSASFSVKLLQVLDTLVIKKEETSKGRGEESSRDTATRGKKVTGAGKDALPELGKGQEPPGGAPLPEIGAGPASRPTGKPLPGPGPTSRPANKPTPGPGSRPSSSPGQEDLPELGSEPLPELGSEPLPGTGKTKNKK